ncbi:MAG TPA: EpsG family protein [Flavipsychrobacter sp.]|nr:EpsG family protein [Flavipsychrobacter sp.]
MHIYLLAIFYISFFSLLEAIGIDNRVRVYAIISIFFILLYIAGLKYETGVDWYLYGQIMDHVKPINTIFEDIKSGYYKNDLDIGYIVFISTIKALGGDLQIVFFCISLFTLTTLIKYCSRYTPNVITAVLLYYATIFFVLDMSGVRQCIAVNIFLIAIKYIPEKKPLKYLITVLIAATFHWSAFFLIPTYFILNKTYSSKSVSIFFVIEVCIFFFKIKWLKSFLELFFPLITNKKLMEKAFVYTSAVTYASFRDLNIVAIGNILFYTLMIIFLIRNRTVLQMKFKYFNVFFNIFLCNIFIFFCTSELLDISSRIQYYFLLSNMILLSYISFLFKRRIERIAVTSVIIFYAIGYSKPYVFESSFTIAYHPYQNYLVYKLFDKKSTGRSRLELHQKIHVKEGLIQD